MGEPDSDYPPVAELLPHAGSMVLLEQVRDHAERETRCSVSIDAQTLFRGADRGVASWIAVEYMAQCIGAHAGMLARAQGRPPDLGFLVGLRGVSFQVERFAPGQRLSVWVRHVWGSAPGMSTFEARVEDAHSGEPLVTGRLSCYTPGESGAADEPEGGA